MNGTGVIPDTSLAAIHTLLNKSFTVNLSFGADE